jgi:hypothetical protein
VGSEASLKWKPNQLKDRTGQFDHYLHLHLGLHRCLHPPLPCRLPGGLRLNAFMIAYMTTASMIRQMYPTEGQLGRALLCDFSDNANGRGVPEAWRGRLFGEGCSVS